MNQDETQFTEDVSGGAVSGVGVSLEGETLRSHPNPTHERVIHFKRPQERGFTRDELGRSTLLFGGLSPRHDAFIQAAVEGLGFLVERIPVPVKADYHTGREYGNNGLCNPAHFTAGALVNYLKRLRDEKGVPLQEILKRYAYVSGGSCGPCRFGMYESEYRLALRNSGFDGFRVLLFQQTGGLEQLAEGTGLEFNLHFALAFVDAVLLGDVMNALACQLRPYETVPGQTDVVLARATRRMESCLREQTQSSSGRGRMSRLWTWAVAFLGEKGADRAELLTHIVRNRYGRALRACAEEIDAGMEVDFLRPKSACKVTGEFWAQLTEGDGNFHMFRFLESQGAEVVVEPILTWVDYLLSQRRNELLDRKGLLRKPGFRERLRQGVAYGRERARLGLTGWALNREYERMRRALGSTTHPLVSQGELRRLGDRFYDTRCMGGEGHLEVAKTIYYTQKCLAHMVMSLKPFGCMPSTQSDGVQAAVLSEFPEVIFVPIETSGEGDINAFSRAQMALGEAKERCKEEFAACVAQSGYDLEAIRRYCAERPELRRPLQQIPRHEGVVGRAANFVLAVAKRMDGDRAARAGRTG